MTATITTARPQLDDENPWPGLESFQEAEGAFFFGREAEAVALSEHVLEAPVTALYGRSGLGKTSLLRAGLFPRLREQHFLPVYMRFEVKSGATPLSWQLRQSVRDVIQAELPDAILPSDEESLWEYLHRKDFHLTKANGDRLTPVIVLDQFEELFTLGERAPDLVEAFRNDFGDLAENRIPAELSARIEGDEALSARFDLRSRNYKLLVSLREDFLAHLEEWCRLIPALGRSRMRLLPLKWDDAFDAVHEPAKNLMTAALAKRVVDIVAGENLHESEATDLDRHGDGARALYLDPAILSLFCRELNEKRKRLGQERFEEQLVEGSKTGILSNYYSLCVRDLPHVAKFIEDQLITDNGRFRNQYAREDAVPSVLTEVELGRLIGSRLLRIVEYHGAQRIELTHDVLTKVVREHRDQRRVEEKQQTLAETAAELDRERHIGRRLRRLSAVLGLVCVLAIVLGVVAVVNWRSAEKARNEAATRLRGVTAERLYGQSMLMQAGVSDEGSNDTSIMQRVLAARAVMPTRQDRKYELFTVLEQERDLLKIVDVASAVTSVEFSPDGTRIASGGGDRTLRVWDAGTGQPVGPPMLGHENWVNSVAFSPDGTRIASGGADNTIRLWDAGTGKPVGPPLRGHENWVNTVAFSPDGARIASGSGDDTIRLWDAATLREIGVLSGHEDAVTELRFSRQGSRLVSGSVDKTIRVWDTRTWQPMLGHDDSVRAARFAEDGHRILSGSDDKTVRLWDAATGHPIGKPLHVDDEGVSTLLPINEDRVLSVAATDQAATVRLRDAHTLSRIGEPLRVVPNWMIAWTETADMIAAKTESGAVQVFAADTMRPIGEPIRPSSELVTWFEFSPDGRILATGDNDGTAQLWDSSTGNPVGEPTKGNAAVAFIEFSRDGHVVAVGYSDNTMRLWDTRSSQPAGTPMRPPPNAGTAAFSPDGRTLASGSLDGSIRLWDTTDQTLSAVLKGHDEQVTDLEFSPDGTRLLSTSQDRTLRMWPVPASPDSARKALCTKLTQTMTPEQWYNLVSEDIPYVEICDGRPEDAHTP